MLVLVGPWKPNHPPKRDEKVEVGMSSVLLITVAWGCWLVVAVVAVVASVGQDWVGAHKEGEGIPQKMVEPDTST